MAKLTKKAAKTLLTMIDGRYTRCEIALSQCQQTIKNIEHDLSHCRQTILSDPVVMKVIQIRTKKLQQDLHRLAKERSQIKEELKREFARRSLLTNLVKNQFHESP